MAWWNEHMQEAATGNLSVAAIKEIGIKSSFDTLIRQKRATSNSLNYRG